MRYGLQVKFVAHPGKRDELVAVLLQAAEILQSNKECILVNETWATKAAHDSSLEPDSIKAVVRQAIPLIASQPTKSS